jgi:hypothetical protein
MTEAQIAANTLKLVLSGKTIEIRKKRILNNQLFLDEIEKHFDGFGELFESSVDKDGNTSIADGLGKVAPYAITKLIPTIAKLPLLYAPDELSVYDNDESTDKEFYEAGLQILEVIVPFFLNSFKEAMAKFPALKSIADRMKENQNEE